MGNEGRICTKVEAGRVWPKKEMVGRGESGRALRVGGCDGGGIEGR